MVDGIPQFGGQDVVGQFLLCPAPARFPHAPGQVGVARGSWPEPRLRQPPASSSAGLVTRFAVIGPRPHDEPGLPVPHGFPGPTAVDGHARHPGRGRLDEDDAETLLFEAPPARPAAQREYVGTGVEIGQVGGGQAAQEVHPDVGVGGQSLETAAVSSPTRRWPPTIRGSRLDTSDAAWIRVSMPLRGTSLLTLETSGPDAGSLSRARAAARSI